MIIKKVIDKIKNIKQKAAISVLGLETFLLTSSATFADVISDRANDAATDAVASIQGIGKPALMVVAAVCGLIFIIGTQRQKDNWKDGILIKIVGVMILVLAIPLADTVYGWFE